MDIRWKLPSLLLLGSLAAGCSESVDTAASATSAAAVSATPASAGTPAQEAQAVAKPTDPLLAGLEFEDPEEFPKARAAYEANRKDVTAIEDYAGMLLGIAYTHASVGNAELANKALAQGGEVIVKAMQDQVKISLVPESTVPAELLYGYACVLSKNEQATRALDVLNKAVKAGFSNEQMLKNDADLAAVRKLPEYETSNAAWTAHFEALRQQHKEKIVAQAKEDLKKQETFDFDFKLTDVNGKPISLDSYQNRVRIVDIWGTWCPPCRQEVPMFVKLQDAYGKYGLQIVGLNDERGPSEDANIETVKNFMANNSVNYPCAIVTPEVIEQVPEFGGFPTTLLIDHTGKVRLKAFGYHEYEYFETAVQELLREQARAKSANTN